MFKYLYKLDSYLRWQIKRIVGLPGFAGNFLFGRLWNDAWLSRKKKISIGAVSPTNCFAVYVIFPKDGLLPSHLVSLTYLVQQGLSPCVVSNVPLKAVEREQILSLCWRLIERPNFGYDFGAYREGVLHIAQHCRSMTELFLLNDSVWFPMPNGHDWIACARRLKSDLVGAVSNGGTDSFLYGQKHGLRWALDPSEKSFHYCSFALKVGAKVLNDPAFLRFWSSFRMTNDKKLTIARGEIGFSRWIIDSGYSHEATLNLTDFESYLNRLDTSRLVEMIEMLVIPESKALRGEQDFLMSAPQDSVGRGELIHFILRTVADTGAAYALAHWALGWAGHDFLKKSPLWLNRQSSELTERIVRKFGTAEMLTEARSIRSVFFP